MTVVDRFNVYYKDILKKYPYECGDCDEKFYCKLELFQHIFIHKTVFENNMCFICGETFDDLNDLHKHLHVETKSVNCKPLQSSMCLACKILFESQSKDDCERSFYRFKTVKKYKCEICQKMFNHKSYLTVHAKIHQNIRLFKCHICDKRFSQKGTLNKHLKNRFGLDILHKCEYCDKKF
ncbi:Zinc finger protein [Lymphocystis disease virus 3]|uniref:Zinc finger protein n=1 Tax=Lymphocystis disease virus 3 TaxID=2560566 RepID=A0A1B2RVU6_9VIRU|nr:Zinc finger protein [Lymphocystis disease virus Sa]AOC55117.1 Zinc finger protein [Lymphocystis disease virus 3]